MRDKIIFFSIDRLGDYLIRSNIIKQISNLYSHREIACSELNFKLISTQKFFNKVHLINKKNLVQKIKHILKFMFKRYHSIIVFDGKTISYISIFLIKAKFKYIFIYKKKGIVNKLSLFIFKIVLKLFNIKFSILNSRAVIEAGELDNYPIKYKELRKYFNTTTHNTYYLENINPKKKLNLQEKYLLIHLDEKFQDILNINNDFSEHLVKFSNNINCKVVLTSFQNSSYYYKNLRLEKFKYPKIFQHNNMHNKIFLVENLPLGDFFTLIKHSSLNISCHAGFLVHISLLLNKKCIDIINMSEENWINCWITNSSNYKRIYKSTLNKRFDIKYILNKVVELENEL